MEGLPRKKAPVVVSALAFIAATALMQQFVARRWEGSFLGFPMGELFFYLALTGLAAVLCRAQGMTAAELGFSRERVWRQLVWGFALTALLTVVFVGTPLLLGYAPNEFLARGAGDVPALFRNIFLLAVIISPMEEFWFHGFLETSARWLSFSLPLCLASVSLLFGLFHLLGGGGLINLATSAVIALLFGWCMHRFDGCTLLSVTLAHSVYNVILELIRWTYCV